MAMGWSMGPNIAQAAIDRRFIDSVLQDFLKQEKLENNDDFPYTQYDDFVRVWVEDLAIFTKQNLTKTGKKSFLVFKSCFFTH